MVKITIPTSIRVPVINNYDNRWRFLYTDSGGTDREFTDDVLFASTERRSLKFGIGLGNISVDTNNGKYKSLFQHGTVIKVYAEHTQGTPTNQIFRGRIDNSNYNLNPSNSWQKLITMRDYPEIADDTISIKFNNAQADNAIRSVVDNNFSSILTYDNLAANMTVPVTGTYVDAKGINVIQDILKQSGFDGYIDFNSDINTFKDGTRNNSREKILYGYNLLPFTQFGRDFTNAFNKIRGYGVKRSDLVLVNTQDDAASQVNSWVKTRTISDGSLESISPLASRVESELNFFKGNLQKGILSAANGLPTLLPGEGVYCSAQNGEIVGFYPAAKVIHTLTQRGLYITHCELSRLSKTTIKDIRELQNSLISASPNPNDMDETMLYYLFNDETDINTLGGLKISVNKLIISTGSEGKLTSNVKTAHKDAVSFEYKLIGTELNISTIKVSSDGGQSFNENNREYSLEGNKDIEIDFTKSGKKIYIEIELKGDSTYGDPELESFELSVKHKT